MSRTASPADFLEALADYIADRLASRLIELRRDSEPKTPPDGNRHCGEKAVADRLRISVRTLQGWRATGKGPAFVKLGRRVVYAPEALERFVSGNAEPIEGATPKANRTGRVAKRGNRAAA